MIKDHEKQRGWTPVVEILVQVVLWSAFPAFAMLCLCQSWLECIALFCHIMITCHVSVEMSFLFMPTLTYILNLTRLLCLARLQESAHWLAVRGRLIEARIVLEHMAKTNGTLGISSFKILRLGKFMGQKSSFQPPKESTHFEEAGPSTVLWPFPSLQCHRNYGATNKSWLVCECLNSLHSNQAVWICLISFNIF